MQEKLLHYEFLGDKDHVSLFNADHPCGLLLRPTGDIEFIHWSHITGFKDLIFK